jgi:signal transduction histidine kinase/flagellar motor switch/type III secretory pathway protein FliN
MGAKEDINKLGNASSFISPLTEQDNSLKEEGDIFAAQLKVITLDIFAQESLSLAALLESKFSNEDVISYKTTAAEISLELQQQSFDLLLFNGLGESSDLESTFIKLLEQIALPVVVVLQASEAAISSVLSWGVQDYLTLEELQDGHHIRKLLEHAIKRYQYQPTDVALHRQAEQTLKHLNLQLENCVADRTSLLRQANFKLRLENTIRKYHTIERQRVEIALHEAKDQLQAVLDAVPGCVAWVSADLRYLGVNQHMARLMQTPAEYFVGKPIGFSGQPTDELIAFMQRFFERPSDSTHHAADEIAVQIHGATRYYLIVGQKYLQGSAAAFVGIDISERKQAEMEIRNSLINAQEINELKSRFIAVVSHEFRTPLTTILTASELLEHYGQQWPLDKTQSYLRRIQSSVNRMTELLEDVLVINAEEAGKLKLNPVSLDIVYFCQSLMEELRLSSGQSHPLLFKSQSTSQEVQLDEKLLRLILSNLISNALKYSPLGHPVEVDLISEKGQITLLVRDRGIGIPPEDKQYLFDLFHRAQNVGTTPGTGLGLTIVKKAVALHGGTIDVQSEVGVGTEFSVKLPCQPLVEEYSW